MNNSIKIEDYKKRKAQIYNSYALEKNTNKNNFNY